MSNVSPVTLVYQKRELKDWYGIPGIKFLPHGVWSDAEIICKGVRLNVHLVEDAMWDRFAEEYPEYQVQSAYPILYERFASYMADHSEDVFELVDECIAQKAQAIC